MRIFYQLLRVFLSEKKPIHFHSPISRHVTRVLLLDTRDSFQELHSLECQSLQRLRCISPSLLSHTLSATGLEPQIYSQTVKYRANPTKSVAFEVKLHVCPNAIDVAFVYLKRS